MSGFPVGRDRGIQRRFSEPEKATDTSHRKEDISTASSADQTQIGEESGVSITHRPEMLSYPTKGSTSERVENSAKEKGKEDPSIKAKESSEAKPLFDGLDVHFSEPNETKILLEGQDDAKVLSQNEASSNLMGDKKDTESAVKIESLSEEAKNLGNFEKEDQGLGLRVKRGESPEISSSPFEIPKRTEEFSVSRSESSDPNKSASNKKVEPPLESIKEGQTEFLAAQKSMQDFIEKASNLAAKSVRDNTEEAQNLVDNLKQDQKDREEIQGDKDASKGKSSDEREIQIDSVNSTAGRGKKEDEKGVVSMKKALTEAAMHNAQETEKSLSSSTKIQTPSSL